MNENYLSSLSGQAINDGILSVDEKNRIQRDLWQFLGERADLYTSYDSSSVPVELAQELLDSIYFVIGLHLKTKDNMASAVSILTNTDIKDLFKSGLKEIESQIDIGKGLLNRAIDSAPSFNNTSYRDTLSEITIFFRKYDFHYFAHDIPCTIDYQLAHPVVGHSGIEFINEYLRHLIIENEFCIKFNNDKVSALLKVYCPDPEGQLINIYEVLVTNAIGLTLTDGDVLNLCITASDRMKLLTMFKAAYQPDIESALQEAAEKLFCCLNINAETERRYLLSSVLELVPRLMQAISSNNLDRFFLSF